MTSTAEAIDTGPTAAERNEREIRPLNLAWRGKDTATERWEGPNGQQ